MGPAAEELSIPSADVTAGARETPSPGGGGTDTGTSAARPDDLRAFEADLWGRPAVLRGRLADFATQCRWGQLCADGVVSGLEHWVAANDQHVTWATILADVFAAVGGESTVSTVADSALAVVLASASVALFWQKPTIDSPQAFGAPPTTGYSDDPVNYDGLGGVCV